MKPDYAAALYVHAIAIEREATERYAELAERMDDLGNHAVAALFGMLSRQEARHLDELRRKSAALALPSPSSDYSWFTYGAPETIARELVLRFMSQRDALVLARDAEKRAHAFFCQAARAAPDPATQALAEEMAAEEAEHIALVERMLERTPAGQVDWEAALADAPG